jgi:nitroimidazol reductase NimA-like FMN-containing flavoprotein (pyridoxamine 5'-phosphate oxidase superfamily)
VTLHTGGEPFRTAFPLSLCSLYALILPCETWGAVFIHSAPAGEKIRILKENPRVCIEVDSIGTVIPGGEPCRWTVSYRSVIAQGTAEWIEDRGEKASALAALVEKYSGRSGVEIPSSGLEDVAVIRIPLAAITGKISRGS